MKRSTDFGKLVDLRCRLANQNFGPVPTIKGLPGFDFGDETFSSRPAKKKSKKLKKAKIEIEDVSTGDL